MVDAYKTALAVTKRAIITADPDSTGISPDSSVTLMKTALSS
jgi:hypothetical protein